MAYKLFDPVVGQYIRNEDSGKLPEEEAENREHRVGRLLGTNSRAAHIFKVEVKEGEKLKPGESNRNSLED
jgi:hypothetical protein